MIKNTEENKKSAVEKEAEVPEVLQQLNSKLLLIGNLVHDSVPVDNDETTPDTQVSQEPLEETAVNESPSKIGENHILPTPRLRRRFVPASNSEDRIHDTTEADLSAPVKLDAAAQAHIEKHSCYLLGEPGTGGPSTPSMIEPESQTQLLDATMNMEGILLAGVPGARGFDAVFAVTLGDSGSNVTKMWSSQNVLALLVREDPCGVSLLSCC
ncbi:hypothetical protein SO802_010137 [Lithocarpus litseifolius]|uniref:Uncharacterized protein n=1 Tax=Lithocarpus litseifolius TaxID=425828 RepID=A0AAW2DHM3_9ROSI